MTDRPILFSAPMVRSILAGRKTMTRRVFKGIEPDANGTFRVFNRHGGTLGVSEADVPTVAPDYVTYSVGDRLWVRETLRANSNDQGARWYGYAADGADAWPMTEWLKSRDSIPSIHMPRWASRITLIVTDVRVQRLQEISEADAEAEGVEKVYYEGPNPAYIDQYGWKDYRDHPHAIAPYATVKKSFESLWDSLNAKRGYGWEQNPWVVALTFEVIKKNIDQIEKEAA